MNKEYDTGNELRIEISIADEYYSYMEWLKKKEEEEDLSQDIDSNNNIIVIQM